MPLCCTCGLAGAVPVATFTATTCAVANVDSFHLDRTFCDVCIECNGGSNGLPEGYYEIPEDFYDKEGNLLVFRHELERCVIRAKSKVSEFMHVVTSTPAFN